MSARIVVGLDGSAIARRALRLAVDEARRRGATVDAVMAYRLPATYPGMGMAAPMLQPEMETMVLEELERELADVPEDVHVERIIGNGHPATVLSDVAEGADLLVVGTRGRGGVAGRLLGSTARGVLSHVHCPVLVVPPLE